MFAVRRTQASTNKKHLVTFSERDLLLNTEYAMRWVRQGVEDEQARKIKHILRVNEFLDRDSLEDDEKKNPRAGCFKDFVRKVG